MNYSPKYFLEKNKIYDFHFKKKFGQNFIVDENVIDKIVTKSNINKDTTILEIGPGAGSLTYKLAQQSKFVLCYEVDEKVKSILSNNLKDQKNIKVIYQDFLKADVVAELDKLKSNEIFLIANLPYYITTPILMKVIEDKISVDKIIIMVQKEVGDRFRASPNTKSYGSLSVFLNYYFEINKLMDVSRNVFMPVPNVDSIVVSFVPRKEKLNLISEDHFFNLIRDSFKQKRKTLKNNLKNYDLNVIDCVLKKHGYNLSTRAEALPIEIFVEISNELYNQ